MRPREDVSGVDLDALRGVFEPAPVTVGILYGSYVRGDDHERSDVDLAVAFEDELSSTERTRERLALIERLSAELGRDDVDVVVLGELPTDLRRSIRRDGVLVYGSLDEAESILDTSESRTEKERPLESFDEILGDIRRVV